MSVVARMYVSTTQRFAYNPESVTVELQAVSRGEENKAWATATPSGSVKLSINNGPAGKWFEERLGKDVLITFEDAGDASHPTPYSA